MANKMNKILSAALLATTVLLGSCTQDEVDTWNVNGYAWFTQKSTSCSFFNSGIEVGGTMTKQIEITVASEIKDYDRTINVEVCRQPAYPETKVSVPATATLKAGETTAQLEVVVTNCQHLEQAFDTIAIRILPSADFEPGLKENQQVNLCLHNGVTRPTWWNDEYRVIANMGYYSELKMQIWWEYMGGDDDPTEDGKYSWYSDYIYYLLMDINDYIMEKGYTYPEGTEFDGVDYSGQIPYFYYYSYSFEDYNY